MNTDRKKERGPEPTKPAWDPPRVDRVGRLREFILGGGKAGSNLDSDPNNVRKSGVG